jgi:ElaB/YqjD/DUF883 family membrane-anchored ribosome-binding protein
MDEKAKDAAAKSATTGSGSDTVSAAKISAGTSVGTVGQAPTPHQAKGNEASRHLGQSETLASHTSKPMGGAGKTGAGTTGAGASAGGGGGKGAEDAGMMDQAKAAASTASAKARDAAESVQEAASEAYEQASEWARDTYERATEWASDGYERGARYYDEASRRSATSFRQGRGSVERFVSENPVLVGVVGLAAGLLLGALLPRTRREDRVFGDWADEVRDQGMRYARDFTQAGRDYVESALDEGQEGQGPSRSGRPGERSGPSGRYQNH